MDIKLSTPHLSGDERALINEALDSNFVTPLGPMVDAFEREFAAYTGVRHAAAVNAGTAALHLGLRLLGVRPGDTVWTCSLTFVGGAVPILYLGARPVFLDVDPTSWTLDPALLDDALSRAAREGRLPAAVMPTDIFGQSCDVAAIRAVCDRYDVPVLLDSAEAAGARYRDRPVGGGAAAAAFSFNGNKIITASGGGMLVSDDEDMIARTRWLAQQARDPAPHYQHSEMGYNYRMSNICAAIGRAQLAVLDDRVARRRAIFARYEKGLADVPGLWFMPEAPYGRSSRWLTVAVIETAAFGADRDTVMNHLAANGIESRPVWKPMHMQPLFEGAPFIGEGVCERLFATGLCLPSGSGLTDADIDRVIATIREACPAVGGG